MGTVMNVWVRSDKNLALNSGICAYLTLKFQQAGVLAHCESICPEVREHLAAECGKLVSKQPVQVWIENLPADCVSTATPAKKDTTSISTSIYIGVPYDTLTSTATWIAQVITVAFEELVPKFDGLIAWESPFVSVDADPIQALSIRVIDVSPTGTVCWE